MSAGSFFLWFEYWPIRLSEKCRPGGRAVSGRSIRNRPLLQRLPGIRAESAFFCAVCIFVPVFPLILGCKLSFLPVTKKGTIDSYIIFPRCPLIFRLDFRRILTYLFLPQKSICFPPLKILFFVGNKKRYNILHHLNEILWIKGKGHENIV